MEFTEFFSKLHFNCNLLLNRVRPYKFTTLGSVFLFRVTSNSGRVRQIVCISIFVYIFNSTSIRYVYISVIKKENYKKSNLFEIQKAILANKAQMASFSFGSYKPILQSSSSSSAVGRIPFNLVSMPNHRLRHRPLPPHSSRWCHKKGSCSIFCRVSLCRNLNPSKSLDAPPSFCGIVTPVERNAGGLSSSITVKYLSSGWINLRQTVNRAKQKQQW